MRRFGKSRKRQFGPAISAAVFLAVFLIFWALLQDLSRNTVHRQREQLETALERGILTCYTLEGRYPESLRYLKDHYPIHYNEDLFFVDYQIQGANMLPDVTIIERGNR